MSELILLNKENVKKNEESKKLKEKQKPLNAIPPGNVLSQRVNGKARAKQKDPFLFALLVCD